MPLRLIFSTQYCFYFGSLHISLPQVRQNFIHEPTLLLFCIINESRLLTDAHVLIVPTCALTTAGVIFDLLTPLPTSDLLYFLPLCLHPSSPLFLSTVVICVNILSLSCLVFMHQLTRPKTRSHRLGARKSVLLAFCKRRRVQLPHFTVPQLGFVWGLFVSVAGYSEHGSVVLGNNMLI